MDNLIDLMKPLVNNNGTSSRELIDQRIKARRAIFAAMKALQETAPHGRDYQTDPTGEAFKHDQKVYCNRFAALDTMYGALMDEALTIQGEEGQRT